ncbi:zinc finger BED domain-containing 1-like, partial [Olea europaea subsp. europaea]
MLSESKRLLDGVHQAPFACVSCGLARLSGRLLRLTFQEGKAAANVHLVGADNLPEVPAVLKYLSWLHCSPVSCAAVVIRSDRIIHSSTGNLAIERCPQQMARKKSWVWQLATVCSKGYEAECNVCIERLSYNGSPSAIGNHLKSVHRLSTKDVPDETTAV